MNTNTQMIIAVVLALVIAGAVLVPALISWRRGKKLQAKFGPEYDLAVKIAGDEKQAQTELAEREKHVEALHIHPLTAAQREQYMAEWSAVQARFVDDPSQAIMDADRLIMEVMQLRAYPLADFDQRAADLSVHYPELVSNYRAARVIALKNANHQADTEDLRQAMVYYHSLFVELLEVEPATA